MCFRQYIEDTKVVVDVGCGAGAFSKALDNGKRLIVALDIQKELLREIRGHNIQRVCADAHNLPFRTGSIDCVLSLSLIEHLREPERHVEELYRILMCDGMAIIQLPNLQYLFEPHSKWPLLCLLPEQFQSKVFKTINYPYVNMKVTIKYALNSLYKAGFRIIRVMRVYYLGVMKLLPMAPSYIFIAEKTC